MILNITNTLISTCFLTTIFSSYFSAGASLIGLAISLFLIVINFNQIKLSNIEFTALIIFTSYCIIVLTFGFNYFSILQNIRFWYGVVIFTIVFRLISFDHLLNYYWLKFFIIIYNTWNTNYKIYYLIIGNIYYSINKSII